MPAPKKKKLDLSLSNLELPAERAKLYSLRTLLTNKHNPRTRDAAKLGDVLLPWYEKTVARPGAKLDGIAELWEKHLPAKIADRCRLVGFQRGTLTVSVDSAAARAELDARLRAGFLRTLQIDSKGSLFRVKTCVEGGLDHGGSQERR